MPRAGDLRPRGWIVTAARWQASPEGWQVSVVVGWPVGEDGMVVGGVMAVMVVAVDGDGTRDGDGVGGAGGC
jgi:hypothetical protein